MISKTELIQRAAMAYAPMSPDNPMLAVDRAEQLAAALERRGHVAKKEPVVWADDASPFTGPQVLNLLKENESLRHQLDRIEGERRGHVQTSDEGTRRCRCIKGNSYEYTDTAVVDCPLHGLHATGCLVSESSSRMCERGTKGCHVWHVQTSGAGTADAPTANVETTTPAGGPEEAGTISSTGYKYPPAEEVTRYVVKITRRQESLVPLEDYEAAYRAQVERETEARTVAAIGEWMKSWLPSLSYDGKLDVQMLVGRLGSGDWKKGGG